MDIALMIMIIVFAVVGLVLIWFVVELALMVRKGRNAVDDMVSDIQPILRNATVLTESIKPAVAKIDPLVERVNLTVDAANLEIMRIDRILEDVGDVTDTVSQATETINSLTNAPVKAVSSVTESVRRFFKGPRASDTSESLALSHEEKEQDAACPAARESHPSSAKEDPSLAISDDDIAEAMASLAQEPTSADSSTKSA